MTVVETLIVAFVEKSGGIEKIEQACEVLRSIPDAERADYVRRVARSDVGARQLMAAALLGFSAATQVYRASGAVARKGAAS